ncbi:hypothetical protein BBN63_32630 [Streptomyces niveus]|uniref:Uncharacterized protein n=1 Tax=Streptomyces niveus TaxID=193462 RepID=A0A1U9R150_STRNV|nr:hypothetical protein BBN63_32630 [Streptomyces niveus]
MRGREELADFSAYCREFLFLESQRGEDTWEVGPPRQGGVAQHNSNFRSWPVEQHRPLAQEGSHDTGQLLSGSKHELELELSRQGSGCLLLADLRMTSLSEGGNLYRGVKQFSQS